MKDSLLKKRMAAFVFDLTLLILPGALIIFASSYVLPPELREDYLLFIFKANLILLIIFYYLIQFLSSLFVPTPGQRIFSIRRVSPGVWPSFLRFFLFGALPMILFVLLSLWPLLLAPLLLLFWGSNWNNPLEEKFSIYFVAQ